MPVLARSRRKSGPLLERASCAFAYVYFARQSFMKVLRSLPFIFFSPASLLHDFIFSCCAVFFSLPLSAFLAMSAPFRHELMNFLRSSALRSPAFVEQSFMRS